MSFGIPVEEDWLFEDMVPIDQSSIHARKPITMEKENPVPKTTSSHRDGLTVEQESILFLRHQFGPTLGR